jgi:copper transport outer membrane protein MctB
LISFRYHLVSIVAVFLALSLGVLIGTTVVNQGVLDQVRSQADKALKRADNLRDEVDSLRAEVATWDRFGKQIQPLLVGNQLSGTQVVLVTVDGVDLSEVSGIDAILSDGAGAEVLATIVVTPRMNLPDDGSEEALATDLGLSGSDPKYKLEDGAARALGARLAAGPPATGDDMLDTLRRDRFLTVRTAAGVDTGSVGGAAQAVVVLSGGQAEPAVDPSLFFQPLVAALVGGDVPVVAAETTETLYPFVSLLRDDGALDGQLVTVDNADNPAGQVAVVLGLRNLILSATGGDFGVKKGSTGLIPVEQ